MKCAPVHGVLVGSLLFFLANCCLGQLQLDRRPELIAKADELAFHQPGLNLFRILPDPWKVVPKIPKIGHPPTDPFSWCIAAHGSSRTGTLNARFLDYFFTQSRVCIHATESKAGLVTVWGLPQSSTKMVATTTILFDKETELPVKLVWDIFRRGYDPEKFLKMEYESFETVTVKWQKFLDKEKNWQLPVRVEIVSNGTGPNADRVEIVNRIRWLLNDEVPDSVFDDPRQRNWFEPTFPDYPSE